MMEDWSENELKNCSLVLYLKGNLDKNTMIFTDPTTDEFYEFLDGKITLSNVHYCVDITKGGLREDLKNDIKNLHKKHNAI